MDRDKFLTEAMGKCWCCDSMYCDERVWFSRWEGFGQLWEWAQEQEWWEKFLWWAPTPDKDDICPVAIGDKHPSNLIHPDRFANAVYEFLKERE